jgi:hypothetical protein
MRCSRRYAKPRSRPCRRTKRSRDGVSRAFGAVAWSCTPAGGSRCITTARTDARVRNIAPNALLSKKESRLEPVPRTVEAGKRRADARGHRLPVWNLTRNQMCVFGCWRMVARRRMPALPGLPCAQRVGAGVPRGREGSGADVSIEAKKRMRKAKAPSAARRSRRTAALAARSTRSPCACGSPRAAGTRTRSTRATRADTGGGSTGATRRPADDESVGDVTPRSHVKVGVHGDGARGDRRGSREDG